MRMFAELNQELERQALPSVTDNTYHWRMTQAMPPVVRQFRKGQVEDEQPSEMQGGAEHSGQVNEDTPQVDLDVLPSIRSQPDLAKHLPGHSQAVGEHALPVEDQITAEASLKRSAY